MRIYICPRTGEPYIPIKDEPADQAPELRWARCVCCSNRGETARALDIPAIAEGGEWHVVPAHSLTRLMDAAVGVTVLRRHAEAAPKTRRTRNNSRTNDRNRA